MRLEAILVSAHGLFLVLGSRITLDSVQRTSKHTGNQIEPYSGKYLIISAISGSLENTRGKHSECSKLTMDMQVELTHGDHTESSK